MVIVGGVKTIASTPTAGLGGATAAMKPELPVWLSTVGKRSPGTEPAATTRRRSPTAGTKPFSGVTVSAPRPVVLPLVPAAPVTASWSCSVPAAKPPAWTTRFMPLVVTSPVTRRVPAASPPGLTVKAPAAPSSVIVPATTPTPCSVPPAKTAGKPAGSSVAVAVANVVVPPSWRNCAFRLPLPLIVSAPWLPTRALGHVMVPSIVREPDTSLVTLLVPATVESSEPVACSSMAPPFRSAAPAPMTKVPFTTRVPEPCSGVFVSVASARITVPVMLTSPVVVASPEKTTGPVSCAPPLSSGRWSVDMTMAAAIPGGRSGSVACASIDAPTARRWSMRDVPPVSSLRIDSPKRNVAPGRMSSEARPGTSGTSKRLWSLTVKVPCCTRTCAAPSASSVKVHVVATLDPPESSSR